MRDAGSLLKATGFINTAIHRDEIVLEYPSMATLMKDLQIMGESNALFGMYEYFNHSNSDLINIGNIISGGMSSNEQIKFIRSVSSVEKIMSWPRSTLYLSSDGQDLNHKFIAVTFSSHENTHRQHFLNVAISIFTWKKFSIHVLIIRINAGKRFSQ